MTWHGMGLFGLLVVVEIIHLHILLMELPGQRRRMEMTFLQVHVMLSRGMGQYG